MISSQKPMSSLVSSRLADETVLTLIQKRRSGFEEKFCLVYITDKAVAKLPDAESTQLHVFVPIVYHYPGFYENMHSIYNRSFHFNLSHFNYQYFSYAGKQMSGQHFTTDCCRNIGTAVAVPAV